MDETRYAKLGLGRKIHISDAQRKILMERAIDNTGQCCCPGGKLCPIGCTGFKDGCTCDEDKDSLRAARGLEPQESGKPVATDTGDGIPF